MKKKNKAREKKEVLANLSILYCIGGADWYLLYLSLKKGINAPEMYQLKY